jgi:hypothetical protein
MTERTFRILLGSVLILLLYVGRSEWIAAYMVIILFEFATNWRVPIVVSRLRFGDAKYAGPTFAGNSRFEFEAERALRFVVAVFIGASVWLIGDPLWFFPWFVAFMLLAAGLTNICPMVMALRWIGFK